MTPFSDIVPYIYDELEKSELFEDDYLDTELKLFKSGKLSMSGGAAITTTGTNIVTIGVQDGTADKDLLTIEIAVESHAP